MQFNSRDGQKSASQANQQQPVPPDQISAQTIEQVFSRFDKSGFGIVLTQDLPAILDELDIQMADTNELKDMLKKLDPDETSQFKLDQLIAVISSHGRVPDTL